MVEGNARGKEASNIEQQLVTMQSHSTIDKSLTQRDA